jgi:hypothetical protein
MKGIETLDFKKIEIWMIIKFLAWFKKDGFLSLGESLSEGICKNSIKIKNYLNRSLKEEIMCIFYNFNEFVS